MKWFLMIVPACLLIACAGWLYEPGGPTDTAVKAGVSKLSEDIDLNHDGIVSTEEVVYATREAAKGRDWETLIWIGMGLLSGAGVTGPLAHKSGQKKGFQKGLYTPVPMVKGGQHAV